MKPKQSINWRNVLRQTDQWIGDRIAAMFPTLSPQKQRWLRIAVWGFLGYLTVGTLQSIGRSSNSSQPSDPILGLVVPALLFFVWQFFNMVTTTKPTGRVRRGGALVSTEDLQEILNPGTQKKQPSPWQVLLFGEESREPEPEANPSPFPQLEIGGIKIPSELENLGFFFVGSPGSGKTQAIKQMLATLRNRPDFRVICLDRNGELLEAFYDEGHDLLFNPKDVRSLDWSHYTEGLEPETIAGGLVPDDPKDRFFSEAAKSLLADLFERCESNAEVWEVISTFSLKEMQDFLVGTVSARYFGSENTGASVLSTLVNEMRFYRRLTDGEGFSFSQWGREDDPRWLFLPVFEDDTEQFKPLYTMAFELMLRGLLSHPDLENRYLKTAIVIDELGALNQLRSLARILAEGRKFGATAILGTQTEAQIDRNYGEYDRRVILQGTATKLILNCRDGQTANIMADLIGKHERVDIQRSIKGGIIPHFEGGSEVIRETYVVMPAQLQTLPNLEGYLVIANGTPPARVKVQPQSYPKQTERFIPDVSPSQPFRAISSSRHGQGSSGQKQTKRFVRTQDRGR